MRPLKAAIWAEALVGPQTGTRTFLENLIRHFIVDHSDRIALTLMLPSWVNPKTLHGCFPEGRWRIVSTQGGRWSNRFAWLAGARSVSPVIGRHDVYFSGWQWPLGREDEPFVGMLHDLRMVDCATRDKSMSLPRRTAWAAIWDMSVRACLSRAAAIVTPSQFTYDHLARLGYVPKQPIVVIPHGVAHAHWSTCTSDATLADTLSRIGASRDHNFVLSIGQHTPHKNFARLIEAFSTRLAIDDPLAQLIIVGAENIETTALRNQIVHLGLEGRVVLAGSVPFDDLRVLMSRARVFAFPSLFEGFGLPVLEAFAAGVPVVTSATTSLGEVAGDAALLVQPANVVEIADALSRAWSYESIRARLVAAGRKRVAAFRWDEAARRHLELFESAAGTVRKSG